MLRKWSCDICGLSALLGTVSRVTRSDDTGKKFPREGQRSMAGREQVQMESTTATISPGAWFLDVPSNLYAIRLKTK